MATEPGNAEWVGEEGWVSMEELATLSGLPESALRELVEYGALVPADPQARTFGGHCVVTVRAARRLREDFELDLNAMALVLSFVERVRALEAEVDALRARMPRRIAQP